jgi:hypothetical protein
VFYRGGITLIVILCFDKRDSNYCNAKNIISQIEKPLIERALLTNEVVSRGELWCNFSPKQRLGKEKDRNLLNVMRNLNFRLIWYADNSWGSEWDDGYERQYYLFISKTGGFLVILENHNYSVCGEDKFDGDKMIHYATTNIEELAKIKESFK